MKKLLAMIVIGMCAGYASAATNDVFGLWIEESVFLAHTDKVEQVALDIWQDTDYEKKDDPVWAMGGWVMCTHTNSGKDGMLLIVPFAQAKGRIQARKEFWKTVLNYAGIQWATGHDIPTENGLECRGYWKPEE